MTKAGTVQVGIPPETIKDSMKLGYAFASHLVVPEVFFDRATGIGCDFEFPTYASKFMGGKKITFICTTNVKKRIQAIFHETLLGGRDFVGSVEGEFAVGAPRDLIPDLKRENGYPEGIRDFKDLVRCLPYSILILRPAVQYLLPCFLG